MRLQSGFGKTIVLNLRFLLFLKLLDFLDMSLLKQNITVLEKKFLLSDEFTVYLRKI